MDLEHMDRVPLIAAEAMERDQAEDAMECEPLAAALEPTQRMAVLGQLVAGFAHDFRALLVPLAGYARALREELPPTHPAQRRLQGMLRVAEMGGQLIEQVLSAAHDRPVPARRLALGEAVRVSLPLLRLALPAGADLRIAIDPGAPEVWASDVQLQRVLLNLVVNAVRAINARHGVIEIGVVGLIGAEQRRGMTPPEAARGPNYVRLTVADNGCGMDAATLGRIRERLSDPVPRGYGGLGLAIVNEIVQAHDGRLSIESHPGGGTSVRIDLPAAGPADTRP